MSTRHDIRSAAGQLLIGGFEGESLPDGVADALTHHRLGGAILFRRNISSLEQTVELNSTISQAPKDVPPWICIDQEGGTVRRLTQDHGVSAIPAMRCLGERDDVPLTAGVSEVIAREVAALGFNVNFTPVVDVDTIDGSFIGTRSFGSDPALVGRMGAAVVAGHTAAGVLSCAKHFPGHGDTQVDSHLALPILHHDRARLAAVELPPFRAVIKAGVPMVMSAHIMLPAIDPDHPATFSPTVMREVLRGDLAFDGLVVSDDLEMAAVAERYGLDESIILGVRAGIDIFLICRQASLWTRAYEVLIRQSEKDSDFRESVMGAATRVLNAKSNLLQGRFQPHPRWRSLINAPEHRAVIARALART